MNVVRWLKKKYTYKIPSHRHHRRNEYELYCLTNTRAELFNIVICYALYATPYTQLHIFEIQFEELVACVWCAWYIIIMFNIVNRYILSSFQTCDLIQSFRFPSLTYKRKIKPIYMLESSRLCLSARSLKFDTKLYICLFV